MGTFIFISLTNVNINCNKGWKMVKAVFFHLELVLSDKNMQKGWKLSHVLRHAGEELTSKLKSQKIAFP